MKWSSLLAIKKPNFGDVVALVLTLSLIFLQEGFTYYLSFQVLALVIIACLIISALPAMKVKTHFLIAFLAFTFSVAVTAAVSPAVISANSSNIFVTVIGILGYAVMIGSQPNLKIKRADMILRVFRFVSSATIVILAVLLLVSETGLIPSLDRDAMISQNSRLIDNFTDADALSANAALDLLMKQTPRNDLFYGEPSYLAIVLFTCLGCFMLISKLREDSGNLFKKNASENVRQYYLIMLTGIVTLLYIQSFSSIIYALIVIYFAFIKGRVNRKRFITSLLFLIIIAAAFMAFSYKYFIFRVTQSSDSLSMVQRFGFLSNISISDLLLGVKEEAVSPYGGIHNGLFYIVAISGFGGLLYLASLLYSMYLLSMPLKSYFFFFVLLLLAIIMQNGGIFSPNKVVLISLLMLPLACTRLIYFQAGHRCRLATLILRPRKQRFNLACVEGRGQRTNEA